MKRYVADTHALLWYVAGSSRLGRAAARVFEGMGTSTEVCVSSISLWEIAQLSDLGHIELPNGYAAWCDALERLAGLRIEPLFADDVEEARRLGALRDPFDRLIGGTALRLGAPVLSADRRLRAERRLRVVW